MGGGTAGHGPGAAKPSLPGGGNGRQRPRPAFGSGPPFLTMQTEKPSDFGRSFRRLVARLRPEGPLLAVVVVLGIVGVVFAILGPKILGNATDVIFTGAVGKQIGEMAPGLSKDQVVGFLRSAGQTQLADMLASMDAIPGVGIDFARLGGILLILVAVYAISFAFSWLSAWIMAGVTQRTIYRLRRDVDEKLGRLPLRTFDQRPRGDILSRVTNDIDNIGQTLQQSLTQLMTAVLTVVGVLVMMVLISPILAVVAILGVPLSIIGTVLIAKRSQKQFAAQWASTGTLNGHIEENHTGHDIVTVFGRQREAMEIFDRENDRLYQAAYRAQFMSGVIHPAMNFVANLQYVAIAVLGGVRVANGQMSLGDVQAFIQYTRQFSMPIVQVASIMNVLQSAIASAERVFELLDEKEEVADPAEPVRLGTPAGRVAFEHVSFRYLPDKPLIDDLSFVAEPGRMVAIVGPTGAGKTTLVNLLMRFYEIDGGRITVDGIDTREMTRDDLRRTFGMVLQDTWLFHGSIRDNIAYGDEGASEQRIVAAAEAAHVDHFVRTMPDGYESVVDDEATNLSQGEKQLLTIARAFLADPPILILDEATSSVDTRTEVLVQRAMAKLLHGRTAFVIAHRLSTIRNADLILVMNDGAIVEQGMHDELLARGGFYADLYESQFAEPLAEAV
jgi:ATP-binding cassette subfamily B protein